MSYEIDPYDPCPCGSGEKYKFCCAKKALDKRHGKFPIGTVALYGPDDKTTTKIAAGVVVSEAAEPILHRWTGGDVLRDPKIADEIKRFFAAHGVKSVVTTTGNVGCPHEEGIDFPLGRDCPFCPFWAGKQGIARPDDEDTEPDPELDDIDDAEGEDESEFDDDPEGLDAEEEDDDEDEDDDFDARMARMDAIVGDDVADRDVAISRVFKHLQAALKLPCEVRATEDFRWEEPYVFGGWSPREYKQLKKTHPSYTDRFELLRLSRDCSPWMMCHDEDIAAHVRRLSDGKLFVLGLCELKAPGRGSPNHELLEDYAVWFWNTR